MLLLDLFLRGSMSVDLIRELRTRFPNLPILVFSIQNEAVFAERALHAGADGYVAKEDAVQELLQGIYSLLQGGVFVSKNLVDRLRFKLVRTSQEDKRAFVGKLSDRELQVLTLLGDGIGLRQAAEDLSLSVKTIETHCARIKRKLGLKDSNDLIRYAAQWKMVLSGIPL
ncbi:MAG: response regulator transcription factor [Deltaproteobacteria bacterium]|nr:response regulator transcription factor [Deltaproteobacteria bacterium]